MAVCLPHDFCRSRTHLIMIQRQDQCNSERRVGPGIDSGDPSPLHLREPTTLEMENSIGRHCPLLDKYEMR